MALQESPYIPSLNMEDLRLTGFKVHELSATADVPVKTGRRDFYKMGLVKGDMTIDYGGRLLEIKGTVLFFVNPKVTHSIVRYVNRTSGYACIFTEHFINNRALQDSPIFSVGDNPVVLLNEEQVLFMTGIYKKMVSIYTGEYPYKADLIRNCIELIIHEALRIQPSQNALPIRNASTRIFHLFVDQLERQFPIEHRSEPLKLRTAQDFAADLSVHVNYLNRTVKQVTGKPTSVYIASRIIAEAKALLQHTDWSVADIGYALGFEYPAYFNNYFKRITGTTPNSFRKV
ncbi:helix-turn-helix domain-containing protein [Pedobacter gandavensis]|uniref:helix-turn-helix domain-containing protein n=1 Tax=Pedobacter gandavensis TaxID=2679963 RepID=UPI00292CAB15|nr:helix-turn-helix domain-containing protein [Pedobacter gandavensis]